MNIIQNNKAIHSS